MDFKDYWDLESAMKVLSHESVDGKLWSEAVKWLILHGPPEIRKLLLDASTIATHTTFPDLKPSHYTPDGQPCYNIGDLATSLGVSEEEILKLLKQKEENLSTQYFFGNDSSKTIH